MNVAVTIPAYNEEKTIARVIRDIPRSIPGVDQVIVIVVDDGSSDRTAEEARKAGADFVVRNSSNQGLAFSFMRGLREALERQADIVVNIDGDYQYNPAEIPKLILPIFRRDADMVIGNRHVRTLAHMPFVNKWGNIVLSGFLRTLLRNHVSDASSGFRAFSRRCAECLDIRSHYTYTLESIIQCSLRGMNIKEVPVEFLKREYGRSRLIKSLLRHIVISGIVIFKTYAKHSFSRGKTKTRNEI